MILFVVTRPLTKVRETPAVSHVASMAEHNHAFTQLRPMDEVRSSIVAHASL